MVSEDSTSLSNLVLITALGLTLRFKSTQQVFVKITPLEILKPPQVEPPQAPIIIKNSIKVLENVGHALKSADEKPVVEDIAVV